MIRGIVEKLYWKFYEEDLRSVEYDKARMDEIFKGIEGNEDIIDLLKMLAKSDRIQSFNAIGDENKQRIAKGQYMRTMFLLKRVRQSSNSAMTVSTLLNKVRR